MIHFRALLNPFGPNAPFLYPLKALGNCKVFWCFQVVEKGCIENNWVNFVLINRANDLDCASREYLFVSEQDFKYKN